VVTTGFPTEADNVVSKPFGWVLKQEMAGYLEVSVFVTSDRELVRPNLCTTATWARHRRPVDYTTRRIR